MPKFVTRRNALFASVAAAGTQAIPATATAAAATDQANVAAALGFWPVISDTPPTETSMYGVPVVWLSSAGALAATPVIPTAPLWSDAKATASIPGNVTGVDYRDGSGILEAGSTVEYAANQTVTITAVAKPGYVINGTSSWKHTFPDLQQFTLIGSDSFAGAATPSLVGRVFDNNVAGATNGVGTASGPLRWFQVGPGSQPNWGAADAGHPYFAGSSGNGLDGAGGFGWLPAGDPPVMNNPSSASSGGQLAADTYYYKVTAVTSRGESGAGANTEKKITTTGSTSKVGLTWSPVAGATSYRIYRGTSTGLSYTMPGNLVGTTTNTYFVDTGLVAPGTLTPWQFDNPNGRPCFQAGRSWKIAFDIANYDYAAAPYIILDAYSDCVMRSQQILLRSTGASTLRGGTLPDGTVIAANGMNGTWQATLLPSGDFTITAPNGQETCMTFDSTLVNDSSLRWARLGFYCSNAKLNTRIKNLRVYKFGA